MKKVYLSILIVLMALNIYAQKDSSQGLSTDQQVFNFVEQSPEFPGGEQALIQFLQQNITYPDMERDSDIQGKVLVRFVVLEDGSVSNVVVVKSVSPGLDNEAVRVVKLLPKFKPGYQQGKPVKVYYNLPIVFKLRDNDESKKVMDEKAGRDADFRTGLLLTQVKDWNGALQSFEQSIKNFPQDYLGYQLKGYCEYSLLKMDDTCKDFKTAKALGSPDVDEFLKTQCK